MKNFSRLVSLLAFLALLPAARASVPASILTCDMGGATLHMSGIEGGGQILFGADEHEKRHMSTGSPCVDTRGNAYRLMLKLNPSILGMFSGIAAGLTFVCVGDSPEGRYSGVFSAAGLLLGEISASLLRTEPSFGGCRMGARGPGPVLNGPVMGGGVLLSQIEVEISRISEGAKRE